ncbi:MAG: molybdenum cofactor guanylyltransferase [Chthoniobacterales bacterium]
MKPFTAALLAGGKSRRMGFDKCLLEFEGTPLWKHQLELLKSVTDEVLVVAPIRPAWLPAEIRWVADAVPDQGPLGGLTSALGASSRDHTLLLAIDLPQMTPTYLCRMIALAEPNQSVVPEWNSHFEPLCAIYARCVRDIALDLLATSDKSLQQLVRMLRARGLARPLEVSAEDHVLFRNLNRPSDCENAGS